MKKYLNGARLLWGTTENMEYVKNKKPHSHRLVEELAPISSTRKYRRSSTIKSKIAYFHLRLWMHYSYL